MFVHRDINQLPVFRNAVITIGTFDGVHTGHRKILDQLKQAAADINGETVIVTFHPHPRRVVKGGESPVVLINTIEERIELLKAYGIDHIVIIPFTEAFSQISANDYVEQFLIGKFRPHTVIIGYDHHFGTGRTGNFELLEKYSAQGSFHLKEIPEHLLNQNIVSSTEIRKAISSGQISEANALLGYEFFFEGKVVDGNKLGRTLGYPTANLKIEDSEKLIPADGIYAVLASLEQDALNKRLKGMMSIGIRPTIGGGDRVIEVNLFDFSADIYHRHLRVYVKHYLRPEVKFENLRQLTLQLDQDKIDSLRLLTS